MTLQAPGFNVSLLRQQTATRRGLPLIMSGRVTGLLGLPVFGTVRVSLEGPSFDPQVTNFDTFAAPTGDYSVPIIADQDGQFTVQAKAYPGLAPLPLALPGIPSPIDLLPPAAQSPSAPIVVGDVLNGTVAINGQRVAVPPPSSVEISAPIAVSPFIQIGGLGAPAAPFTLAAPTGLPPDQPSPITIITITQPPDGVPTAPAPVDEGIVGVQIVGFTIEG